MNLDELYTLKAAEAAGSIFVILAEKRDGTLILIPDIGTDKPWSTRNRQLADSHAKDFERMPIFTKAGVFTIAEAFDLLHKQHLNRRKN